MVASGGAETRLSRIALVGNSPPRLCGIATFTDDLRAGLAASHPSIVVDTYAMTDPAGRYDYPANVVCEIAQDDVGDYAAAAHRINMSGADIVCVQHEYGIFGGAAGVHLLNLLDRVRLPVVVTLHTVLEDPTADQRTVIDGLVGCAAKLVVMAEKGREILVANGVARDRIAVIPHGVPDRPRADAAPLKARFGFVGRQVLMTFGLIGPGKGLETMIRALPAIAADHPDVLYVILGATHPHLVAREGEAYREGLVTLADSLGVSGHVRFIDAFLDRETMLDHLAAADVYVTPYLNEAQITSGTLSIAVALGKPVVSTRYWHAAELLGDGTGVLVPFGDPGALAVAVGALLDDPARRTAIEANAWAAGRAMIWPAVADAYVELFEGVIAAQPVRLPRETAREVAPAPPSLAGIERLTDGCGIVQHSIYSVPDRAHGYCVDDNCRALMLMHRIEGADAVRADALATIYAGFVQHAWNGTLGRFRNFMAFDRTWLEREGSEDSFGRSLWSLGDTVRRARRHDLRTWAAQLFDQVAPHAFALGSPRTWAFAILGAEAMLVALPGHELAGALVVELGRRLHARLVATRREGWTWFESVLAYDNARLPQALLRAGIRLGNADMTADALATFAWLDEAQTGDAGQFRAVGTDSFGREFAAPLPFDQQPLEAWASIDAAIDAFEVTDDAHWVASARRAYAWYRGGNDLGSPIASAGNGGCFDGLMPNRVNLNQGAESVLAYQFACCAMREMTEKARRTGRRAPSAVAT